MKNCSICAILFLLLCATSTISVLASGSGHHSHSHEESAVSTNENVTHKDSQGGIDAYLEFTKAEMPGSKTLGDFFAKCIVKATLKDSKSGKSITPSRLVLRATKGHDHFGEALVFSVEEDNVMQTSLFVKGKGEHHYLLIADIEGIGVKEFHFHHTF